MRLDPHSLPVRFDAQDSRADGGIRHIEVSRERVVVRRAVSGIAMVLRLNVGDYLGVGLRCSADAGAIIVALEHRDPSLCVPLTVCERSEDAASAWQMWATTLSLPRLVPDTIASPQRSGARKKGPAPRRRRRNAIKWRRPRQLMRRKVGTPLVTMAVHAGEREIIARN
jgi:hypothetical protein